MRYVSVSKRKNGMTVYRVGYAKLEKRYTSDNVPNTVIDFMQTHSYRHTDSGLLFE